MAQPQPITVSVKAAGEMVGLSVWTIRDRCKSGAIESHFEGRKRLVDVESLRSYIKGLPAEPPAGGAA